jgi:hypothetical protein
LHVPPALNLRFPCVPVSSKEQSSSFPWKCFRSTKATKDSQDAKKR